MTGRRRSATIFLILLLAGCAGLRGAGPSAVTQFEGLLTVEAGRSLFRVCGPAEADTVWWASFHGYAEEQRERLRSTGLLDMPRPLFVRVYGDVSRIRPGGLNRHPTTRDLYVRELIETRPGGECPAGVGRSSETDGID